MKTWVKTVLFVVLALVVLPGGLAWYLYLQVGTRVSIESRNRIPAFHNAESIERLDSTTVSTDSVTSFIESLLKSSNVTGLAVSVINNGHVVYQQYFGQRNKPKSEPFTPGTIFYGASFSKTMLSDITLQLVEAGKLHLDSPLYKYLHKALPEYRTSVIQQFFGANHYDYSDLQGDEQYKKVTARMCLTHTTGLPNWRWIEPDGKLRFKFQPGQRYSYSGEGMFLLQLVLEEICKKRFEDIAVEYIFIPLNLDRSSFVWQRGYESNYAIGHDVNGNFLGIPKQNAPNAAGSLSTTLEEYTGYFNDVLSQKHDRYRLMTTKNVTIPFKRQFGPEASLETHENDAIELGYGLGYGVYQTPFGRAFFKEGHGDGWQHYAVGFPDRGTALILMSNSDNAEKNFTELIEFLTGNRFTPWYWEGYDQRTLSQ